MAIFALKTHDPSGSGYIGTLGIEHHRTNEGEPPYQEVQCLAVKVTGWSVWKRGETETAFLSTDEVTQLRDALNRYLATRQQSS